MHSIKCGLLSLTFCGLCVCAYVCYTKRWVLQIQQNWLRFPLGCGLEWAQETMYYMGAWIPTKGAILRRISQHTVSKNPSKNSWTNQDALWDVDSDGPKNHLLDKGPDHVGSKEPCIKWGSRSWQRLCVQRWVCSGDVDLCQITLDICYFNQCKTTFTGFVKVTSSAESALLKKTSAMLSIDWPQKTQACITLPTAANHKAKFTHIQWQQTGHCYFQYTAKKITYK